MRTDFDKQWERRKAWRAECPLDDAELRRRVLRAQTLGAHHSPLTTRLWLPAAAAACLLAVLLPLGLRAHQADGPDRVTLEGKEFYFICNNNCSPAEMIELINTIK